MIRVFEYDAVARRSDPLGLLVRYEFDGPVPPARVTFDMDDDGEPPQVVDFPVVHGSDARYFKAFAFKPTREGAFDLVLRALDAGGREVASARCPGVTVLP